MSLSILECRSCGATFWSGIDYSGAIAAGPCCNGIAVLDVETYPTERLASKAYPAWAAADAASMLQSRAQAESGQQQRNQHHHDQYQHDQHQRRAA